MKHETCNKTLTQGERNNNETNYELHHIVLYFYYNNLKIMYCKNTNIHCNTAFK